MARQIYRQEALERLSSPEQLDLLMPVTSLRGWIALLGVGMLLAVGMAWAIFGTVETTVEGNGLLMRYGGMGWAVAPHAGRVAEMLVNEGDTVAAGEVLLHFSYLDADGREALQEIRSPLDGRVLDIKGGNVQEGTPLVSVESPAAPLQAVIYVPAGEGYKIETGMPAQILPATETDHGAAYLPGRVNRAARFPASQAEMMDRLQSDEWAGSFLALGPVLEVVIDVTSAKPPVHLYSGTPCKAGVTVRTRRPIEFLVPGFDNQ